MARSAEHERPAADFTLSPFLKKVENSMPKGMPKLVFFHQKFAPGPGRGPTEGVLAFAPGPGRGPTEGVLAFVGKSGCGFVFDAH